MLRFALPGLLAFAGCATEDAAPVRPNWVVIAPDSMRADRLGTRPDGVTVAPNMTALAHDGVWFSQAYSQSGWTAPALASLLTGHYPAFYERAPGSGPSQANWLPGTRTLPEILHYYGYRTAVFWGRSIPSKIPAFSVGFDDVSVADDRAPMREGDAFAGWLGAHPPEPFFALIHEVDFSSVVTPPSQGLPREDGRRMYDALVNRYDGVVGGVVQQLAQAGVGDHTIIVITSNHGLDFFEHDANSSHGMLYDSILRVPMVIHDPMQSARGQVVDATVQGIDLSPTVLARSGIPVDATMDGSSLLPLLGPKTTDGAAFPERDVYSESSDAAMSIRTPAYKLMACRTGCCGGAVARATPGPLVCEGVIEHRLYDLAADPEELHDIAAERPDVAGGLTQRLTAWQAARGVGPAAATQWKIDEAQKKMLQERGYWGLMFPDEGKAAPPAVP